MPVEHKEGLLPSLFVKHGYNIIGTGPITLFRQNIITVQALLKREVLHTGAHLQ